MSEANIAEAELAKVEGFQHRHFRRGVETLVPDLIKRLNAHARELKQCELRRDILMACNWLASMQEKFKPETPKGDNT